MESVKGYVLAGISAAGFATLGIFAKYAYGFGLNVPTLLTWRFGLAAALLWLWLACTRQPMPARRDVIWLAFMGGIGYNAMAGLFLTANRYAPAGLVSAILYTYPALVALELALLGWEAMTRTRVLALTGTALGCGLVALARNQSPGSTVMIGALLALAGAIIYSIYISLGSRVVQRVSAIVSTTIVCTSAAVVQMLIGVWRGSLLAVPPAAWWTIAGQVLCATVVAILGFFAGVRLIGPGRAAIVSTLEPVGAVVLGFVLLGERLTSWQMLGGLLVLASVVALQVEKPAAKPAATA